MAACRPIVFAFACLAQVATSACGVQTTNNRSGGGSEVKTADAAQPQFGLTGFAPVQLYEIVGRQVYYHSDQDRYATALNVLGFVTPTPSAVCGYCPLINSAAPIDREVEARPAPWILMTSPEVMID